MNEIPRLEVFPIFNLFAVYQINDSLHTHFLKSTLKMTLRRDLKKLFKFYLSYSQYQVHTPPVSAD